LNSSKTILLLFMYIAPVIWGRPMPSPMSRMTFFGLGRSVVGIPEVAGFDVEHARRESVARTGSNFLNDRSILFSGKGFDGPLALQLEENCGQFAGGPFGFVG